MSQAIFSPMELLMVGLLCLAVGVMLGALIWESRQVKKTAPQPIVPRGTSLPLTPEPEQIDNADSAPVEFPVSGKPRQIPWRVRKRELEGKHRTKREKMEEWG